MMIRFPKKRYIIRKIQFSSGNGGGIPASARFWVPQGNWDGSTNLFPTVGRLGDPIKEGYTWDVALPTTTLFGPDGGIIPVDAIIRARVDNPGQTLSNWVIKY